MEEGPQAGLQTIATKVDEFVKQHLQDWNKVRGIGLGVPGIPDSKFRKLISPPKLGMWLNVDIPLYLRQKLELDENFPIYLDNDANMGALGESRYGKGRGVKHLIYIKLGMGIGAGLIINGQLYRGENGTAGEIGHIIIEDDPTKQEIPLCPSCEKAGCLEAWAGLQAILYDAYLGTSLHGEENISTTAMLNESVNKNQMDMVDVIIRAENGDPACQAALKHAGERISKAIGSYLINVYNPKMILLDGGIIRPSRGEAVYINKFLFDVLEQPLVVVASIFRHQVVPANGHPDEGRSNEHGAFDRGPRTVARS